ncbi:MAG: penicillin-binding protein 2 [Ilumatobacteraceae bacterium]
MGTVLVFGLILTRVGMLQTAEATSYQNAGTSQRTREATLDASRGVIFDRNGDELALSVPATTIYVNPKFVLDAAGTATTLASALGLPADKQASLTVAMQDKTKGFVFVARQVETTLARSVMALGLNGVYSYTEDTRVVPGGDLAKSVIGRTDIDGTGTAGLELEYNKILTGTDGERVSEIDTKGNVIPSSGTVSRAAVPGQDLVLTIDRSIQYSLEQALLKQVSSLPAKGGTGIVMESGTGNILAMATVERDDQGVYHVTSANKAMTECNEPGSVAKVITASAALNEGTVVPTTSFNVPWFRNFNENTKWQKTIRDAEPHKEEWWSVRDILVHSSNIGTMLLSDTIGPEKQYDYMKAFGFGDKTTLDFPGETSGLFRDWHQWEGTEKLTPAYGYGVCVPSIQLVSAVNVVANGGVYVAPRLLQATIGTDGVPVAAEPSVTRVVIEPEVAAEVNTMLQAVVCDGTAKGAQVDGITIAGKTGTAVKLNDKGMYPTKEEDRKYYSSFVGFFPAEAPAVTTLISIDEPPAATQDRFGGTAAAPVFKDIVPSIMHQQGIQPPTANGGCPEK